MRRCIQFIVAMVISFLPGIFAVFFTPHGNSHIWYNGLIKTGLTPPGWVFSVAWTILYFLLGWALYLVIKHEKHIREKIWAYVLFGAQVILNALWSYVFFGAHLAGLGLVILLGLFVVSAFMARVFDRFDRRAAYMVIPYLLWLLFAFYMNAYIALMN